MDQQTRTAGTYVVAILLFMIAFIFFCFGIGLLFAFPDLLALVGVVVLAFSGVFIYSGVKNLKDAKLMDRDATLQIRKATAVLEVSANGGKNLANPNQSPSDIAVMAHWQYSNEEWTRFMKWERSRRKTSSTVEAFLIIILGSLVLRSLRDASWPEAIAISGAFTVIYWTGKYYISMNSIGKRKSNEVILTSRSVIINGKVNSFSDGLYWLNKVELIEEKDISVLQFEYGWNTRKGPSSEEIRVPVPNSKIEEARELIKRY